MIQSAYAVVVGAANIDILGQPQNALLLGDSNPGNVSCSAGGVGRNIAENLARMGSGTRLISAVGTDAFGQLIITQCQQAGLATQDILQVEGVPTSTYLSVLNGGNDLHVAINDMAILKHLTVEQLKPHDDILKQAKLIIIDANLPVLTLAYLLNNYADRPLFVDTVSSVKAVKIKNHLHAIHTLKPNLAEAEALSDICITDYAELPRLANWFHKQGVGRMFISLGADGLFFSDNTTQILIPALPAQMVNANGAGDAFMAGLAHAFMQDWSISQTNTFAMGAAVLALSDIATINPTMSELSVNQITMNVTCHLDHKDDKR